MAVKRLLVQRLGVPRRGSCRQENIFIRFNLQSGLRQNPRCVLIAGDIDQQVLTRSC